jgi:hypothetical protein
MTVQAQFRDTIPTINLDDSTAEYMGDGCWVLERLEKTARGNRRHTFGITEEDRAKLVASWQALLSTARRGLASEGAPLVQPPLAVLQLKDGEGHYMGDGCFVLTRIERLDFKKIPQAIGVTVADLERLGGLPMAA